MAGLEGVADSRHQSYLPADEWCSGVHKAVRAEGGRWRLLRPQTGCTHLDVLVRESTVHRLAAAATEFVEERGLIYGPVKQSY